MAHRLPSNASTNLSVEPCQPPGFVCFCPVSSPHRVFSQASPHLTVSSTLYLFSPVIPSTWNPFPLPSHPSLKSAFLFSRETPCRWIGCRARMGLLSRGHPCVEESAFTELGSPTAQEHVYALLKERPTGVVAVWFFPSKAAVKISF